MPIHLPDALPPQLAALARDADASRLVLFGSRARGDDRERSDIDLAVFGLDAAQAGRLRLALRSCPPFWNLTWSVLTRIPPPNCWTTLNGKE